MKGPQAGAEMRGVWDMLAPCHIAKPSFPSEQVAPHTQELSEPSPRQPAWVLSMPPPCGLPVSLEKAGEPWRPLLAEHPRGSVLRPCAGSSSRPLALHPGVQGDSASGFQDPHLGQ